MKIDIELLPQILLQITAVILSIFIIVYTLSTEKRNRLIHIFIACQFSLILWISSFTAEMFCQSDAGRWLFMRLEFISLTVLLLCWIAFCLRYTQMNKVIRMNFLLFLSVIPVACLILVLTNDWHHWVILVVKANQRIRTKPLYLIITLVDCSYFLFGVMMVVLYPKKHFYLQRKQYYLIATAVLIPILAKIASNLVRPHANPYFSLTPASLSLSLSLAAIAIFKYEFLNLVPLAMKETFQQINEAILLADDSNIIVKYNEKFVKEFSNLLKLKEGKSIYSFTEVLKKHIDSGYNSSEELFVHMEALRAGYISGEICVKCPDLKWYFIVVKPLHTTDNNYVGKIISFDDITSYKTLQEELELKNKNLKEKNEELEILNNRIAEMAIKLERERFIRDTHNNIGQSFTLIISLLGLAMKEFGSEPDKALSNISQAHQRAKSGLKELRYILSGMDANNYNSSSFVKSIRALASNFKPLCMDVNLSISGAIPPELSTVYFEAMERICQEALTNSLRHGSATDVNLIIQFNLYTIKLYIFDNGNGCKSVVKGLGLAHIERDVKKLNGTINYGSGDNHGFYINIIIPLGGDQE